MKRCLSSGSSFEVEAEQYVHQPFGEQLAVHIGQYAAVGDAMFQYFGKRVQPETTVFFVGIGIGNLLLQLLKRNATDHTYSGNVFLNQIPGLFEGRTGLIKEVACDLFLLFFPDFVPALFDQGVLIAEQFVECPLGDLQLLCDLIHPDGTDAVPDDEVPRRADDFFACYPAFHCYLSVSDSISRPPPRAW